MSETPTSDNNFTFLGQKRRVRPVRKVQVSTHFSQLDIPKLNGGDTTPPPPPIDEALIKKIDNEAEVTTASPKAKLPEAKSAVYAAKPAVTPNEMNTLVPEDFAIDEFAFMETKPKHSDVKTADYSRKEIAQVSTPPQIIPPRDVTITQDKPAAPVSLLQSKPQYKVPESPPTSSPAKIESENVAVAVVPMAVLTPPPPLPTNNSHLIAARESLKPTILPVKPMNGAPSETARSETTKSKTEESMASAAATTAVMVSNSSPLASKSISSEELESLKRDIERQKLALEREINSKLILEAQLQTLLTKTEAQDEAIKMKNERIDRLESDYIKANDTLTSLRSDKIQIEKELAKAEEELRGTSDSNAKVYLEKSDQVNSLKDKLAEFAATIIQKDKEILSLTNQLKDAHDTNLKTALESVNQCDGLEDDLIKMVEEEILRMQDTIFEQRDYNAKLKLEVESEYAFWKRNLGKEEASS